MDDDGDNVYMHCAGGTHRAPTAGGVFTADATGRTYEAAKAEIQRLRHVDFRSARNLEGSWIDTILDTSPVPQPRVECWSVSLQAASSFTHACVWLRGSDGSTRPAPLCGWGQQGRRPVPMTGPIDTTEDHRVAKQWGRELCPRCERFLPCSVLFHLLHTNA